MVRGLISGCVTPCGMRSKFVWSFWFSFTSEFSRSSPTRNRTMTRLDPSWDCEYTYSTPGISHSSFSMGRVTRSSISRGPDPGIDTITSIMGTRICGSSSRGNSATAPKPSNTDAIRSSGVSFEFAKAADNHPENPPCSSGLSSSGDPSSINARSRRGHPPDQSRPRPPRPPPALQGCWPCRLLSVR